MPIVFVFLQRLLSETTLVVWTLKWKLWLLTVRFEPSFEIHVFRGCHVGGGHLPSSYRGGLFSRYDAGTGIYRSTLVFACHFLPVIAPYSSSSSLSFF